MPFDILHHDDCIVHHETDRQHDGQQCEKVDRKAGQHHEEHRSHKRNGDGDHGDDHRAQGSHEQEDHDNHNEKRFRKRLEHIVDCAFDIDRGVIRDADLHSGRQATLDLRERFAHRPHHVEGIGVRQRPYSHEGGLLAAEAHVIVVRFRAQNNIGYVPQSNDGTAFLTDHQIAKLFGGLQVGVRHEINRNHRALGLPDGSQVVVGLERRVDVGR